MGQPDRLAYRSTVHGSTKKVHARRDCKHLKTVPDDQIKEEPPETWPEWIERCSVCYDE